MKNTSPNNYSVISSHSFADIINNSKTQQKSLHTTTAFNAGETICKFSAATELENPTYLTVQTGINNHITLSPSFLQYINHSCEPNVFFNTSSMELMALKDISVGDELVFFYPSTEWDMTQPFQCFCGSSACLKEIKGATYLSADTITKYQFTEFILKQLGA